MSLFTKSIQEPVSKKDGVRICVMRRPKEDAKWDILMPNLSPSNKLLSDYLYEGITWDEYVERFEKEIFEGQKEALEILIEMAKNRDVTILCWEETPEKCHRRLVAEQCKKLESKLEVVIK
jgi:uncharacterized protein YeaO (DUF488 family)